MVMILGGSGTANGITSFSSAANFNSTLSITGALTQSSSAAFNLASGQLTFPATQNPSGNANTLDDYEEGTWSPTITSSSTVPTGITYTYQRGAYVKIGRMVYVSITIGATWTNSPTGQFQVTLPFTVNDPATAYSCAYLGYYNASFSFGAGKTQLMGEFYSGGGAIMQLTVGGTAGASAYVTYSGGTATVSSGFFIEAAGIYQTAN